MGRDGAGPGSPGVVNERQAPDNSSPGRSGYDGFGSENGGDYADPDNNSNVANSAGGRDDFSKTRVDSAPEDPTRLQGGYEFVQAGKTKVPGESVTDPNAPEGRRGYALGNSVNHIGDEVDYPAVERALDNIEQA